ncbi:N-carbamoyl-L-amino acid hydrolase [Cryphonectria parasitica EP155]|uniref:N-carbamoyl-L-amino acid hydrolase n=1 Tax=Cryphonectria parasitica (strain ATCC 38755 / EP155) TaxID=660469 RepID=A0A9P4Y637_CRYP1|nr:N-carbamoyl-L-amino acid hydrolase [Cryphonectria parasitica EP155]KAF3767171.1 N-carbamoyl-L-amino acid hydrolase [Cryphonectria parasitica EP155]
MLSNWPAIRTRLARSVCCPRQWGYHGNLTPAPLRSSTRCFSSTKPASLRTLDLTETSLKAIKVDQNRLMDTLHHTCAFGTGLRWGRQDLILSSIFNAPFAPTETGMSRLALSDTDKQARDWFVDTTRSLGCEVVIDAMGNTFAVRPGRRKNVPPIYAGSHLDTQPAAGRYDGILGILAGVEMLHLLRDHQIETEHPIGVVNWTNEEGARFPISMVSSGVWAGDITLERAHNVQEVGGGSATMKSELERIGYLGIFPASYQLTPMAAHFELHIEQGPILEAEKQKIGIVQGVQAYKWFTIDVQGRASHTGTTPFSARADALLLASRMITHSNRVATQHSALASTGILTLSPGSVNTVPGDVRFSLDVRAAADETVEAVEAQLKRDFATMAGGGSVEGEDITPQRLPLSVHWTTDFVSPAVLFHEDCISAVRAAAQSVLGDEGLYRDMTSGAGHDSVYTSRRCPTSMIFVPSRNGVSHHPEEWTSDEDCTLGAEVLFQSVLRYDRGMAKGAIFKGDFNMVS